VRLLTACAGRGGHDLGGVTPVAGRVTRELRDAGRTGCRHCPIGMPAASSQGHVGGSGVDAARRRTGGRSSGVGFRRRECARGRSGVDGFGEAGSGRRHGAAREGRASSGCRSGDGRRPARRGRLGRRRDAGGGRRHLPVAGLGSDARRGRLGAEDRRARAWRRRGGWRRRPRPSRAVGVHDLGRRCRRGTGWDGGRGSGRHVDRRLGHPGLGRLGRPRGRAGKRRLGARRARGDCRGHVRHGRRRDHETGGQKVEGIAVAVRVRRDTNTEVDVRLGPLRLAAPPRDADGVALGDGRTLRDVERAEMRQRDREAVRGLDRQGEAVGGDGPRERDDSRRGSTQDLALGARDVDAAVLASCVGIRTVRIGTQHGAPQRPAPRGRAGRCSECSSRDGEQQRRQASPPSRTHGTHVPSFLPLTGVFA
jgi:hypothetical protein